MAPPTFRLIMQSPPTPGKEFALTKDEIFLGREASCDIVLSDAEVSRRHARIYLGTSGYVIEDLGSTNGTFVNDQRLSGPHLLQSGELVRLGENTNLSYQATVFDPNATMISSPPQADYSLPPEPVITTQEPVAFAGQVPPGPADSAVVADVPVKKSNTRTWILAGCGCLLVVCCALAVGAYFFDKSNLYCSPPFDTLFRLFISCP